MKGCVVTLGLAHKGNSLLQPDARKLDRGMQDFLEGGGDQGEGGGRYQPIIRPNFSENY